MTINFLFITLRTVFLCKCTLPRQILLTTLLLLLYTNRSDESFHFKYVAVLFLLSQCLNGTKCNFTYMQWGNMRVSLSFFRHAYILPHIARFVVMDNLADASSLLHHSSQLQRNVYNAFLNHLFLTSETKHSLMIVYKLNYRTLHIRFLKLRPNHPMYIFTIKSHWIYSQYSQSSKVTLDRVVVSNHAKSPLLKLFFEKQNGKCT